MSDLRKQYTGRYERALLPIAKALEEYLRDLFGDVERIDRITARAKSVDRFIGKAEKIEDGETKYSEPLEQIQDQLGARIITFYKSDVERIDAIIDQYFRPIESKDVVPQHEWTFGYFGRHRILLLPTELFSCSEDRDSIPTVFELQIKTLFEHAWSEANHDLGYKPGEVSLEPGHARLLAYTSAQAWGADRVFDDLFQKRAQ